MMAEARCRARWSSPRGEDPDDRCRGHPDYGAFPGQDYSATQKPDSSDHLRQHAGRVYPVALERRSQSDEQLGTEADENAGTNSRGLPPQLALETDNPAAEDGGAEAEPEGGRVRVERSKQRGRASWIGALSLLPLALEKGGLGSKHLLVYPPKQRVVELHELLPRGRAVTPAGACLHSSDTTWVGTASTPRAIVGYLRQS